MTPDPLTQFGYDCGMALSERKVPEEWDVANLTPTQVLEGTATLLDRLDDATDRFLAAHGDDRKTDRSMQRDLRALAASLVS